MKANYIARFAIATGVIFSGVHANATLLFQEGFDYTSGSLGGNVNPGSGLAWEPGNSGLTIGSSSLSYSGLQTLSGNELSVAWGSSGSATNSFSNVTSGQIYYSFLLNVTTVAGANDYLTALNPGAAAPGGSSDAIDCYLYSNGKLGLRTAGESTVTTSTALSLDTTYMVVLEYNFATTTASLYLDPTIGDSQPTATLTLAGSGTVSSIDDVGFKSQSTTGDFDVGNLLIGTTWADVTPEADATPEPGTLSLLGAGAGLLTLIQCRRVRGKIL